MIAQLLFTELSCAEQSASGLLAHLPRSIYLITWIGVTFVFCLQFAWNKLSAFDNTFLTGNIYFRILFIDRVCAVWWIYICGDHVIGDIQLYFEITKNGCEAIFLKDFLPTIWFKYFKDNLNLHKLLYYSITTKNIEII